MAYCTVEDFYEAADFDDSVVSQPVVENLIDKAYNKINNLSGTGFGTTSAEFLTITEKLDPVKNFTSEATDFVVVSKYPVQSLSSISVNNVSYATTEFDTRVDRITISTSATTIATFGTIPGSVSVTYTYGTNDVGKRGAAKELNVLLALYDFVTTPKGRNVYLDNSRFAEINQNNVRPNDMVDTFISGLKDKIASVEKELGRAEVFF